MFEINSNIALREICCLHEAHVAVLAPLTGPLQHQLVLVEGAAHEIHLNREIKGLGKISAATFIVKLELVTFHHSHCFVSMIT